MKLKYLPLLIAINAFAENVDLASANNYKMQYTFSPPPILTPQTDLLTPIESQFSYQAPWNLPSVTRDVANNANPLQIAAQVNQHANSQRLLFRHRDSNYYAIAHAYHLQHKDYQDAKGNKIRAGYKRDGQNFIFGYVPNSQQEYRLTLIRDNIKDDKQALHPQMDALLTKRQVINGTVRFGAADQSNTANVNIRRVKLDRAANNSLRPAATQKIEMNVEREILTGSLDYRRKIDAHKIQLGINLEKDEHRAERFAITPKGKMRNAFRFPDVHSKRIHLFYDHFYDLNNQNTISGGISYDRLQADPKAKNVASTIMNNNFPAPNQLWKKYYGASVNKKLKTDGFGVLVKYEFKPQENQTYSLTASSLIRQPDNVERFHALVGANGQGWIGNPYLKPERHNSISLAATLNGENWREYGKGKGWQISATATYDKVNNFITLDRARKQSSINEADLTTVSRNVDAAITNVELGAAANFNSNWSARGLLRYQRGNNDTDNRALYNIRPLTLDAALDYYAFANFGMYNFGVSIQHAQKQKRSDNDVKTGFGLDNPTKAYTIANIYGGIQTKNRLGISFGIDNITNHYYHVFNQTPHTGPQKPLLVAAPERTYWLGVNFNF